jgi:hypothetical protein
MEREQSNCSDGSNQKDSPRLHLEDCDVSGTGFLPSEDNRVLRMIACPHWENSLIRPLLLRWTHKWTPVKPGWHPVFFRLACIFAMAVSPTVAGFASSAGWYDLTGVSFCLTPSNS